MEETGKQMSCDTCWLTRDSDQNYIYGGLTFIPRDMEELPWFVDLTDMVARETGNSDHPPNSAVVNLYRGPEDFVAFHSDDERLFRGDERPIQINRLSLGATREFKWRVRGDRKSNKKTKVALET